jgi:hypothetical protein
LVYPGLYAQTVDKLHDETPFESYAAMSLFDRWKDKLPNRHACYCGYEFIISQRVQRRALDCPGCGRYYLYVRNLNNSFTVEQLGRFTSKKKRDERTLDYAKTSLD